MLYRADLTPFTTRVTQYAFRPATERETIGRILLDITINDVRTTGALDTGGVYLVCAPPIASKLSLDLQTADAKDLVLLIRGNRIAGSLHRVRVAIQSPQSSGILFEPLAFVPDDDEPWPVGVPCILGMHGCLERLRFAIDPEHDEFHFDPLGEY